VQRVNWRSERLALLGAAGLIVSLVATACGGGSSAPTTTATIVLTAATKSAGTGSFHLSGDFRTVETAHPAVVEDTGTLTGEVDIAQGRSLLTTTDTSSPGVSSTEMPGAGVPSPSGQSAEPPDSIPPPTMSDTTTVIEIGRHLWLSGGGGLLGQPANSWVEVTLPATQVVAPPDEIGILGDPSQIFSQLKSHLNGVTLLGHQIVDGTPTAHYQGRDTWQIPKDISGSPASVIINVWVDQSGLVRQMEIASQTPALSIKDAPTIPAETSTATMRFFDFGASVNIQAPPAGQVITNPSTNLFGQGSSNQP